MASGFGSGFDCAIAVDRLLELAAIQTLEDLVVFPLNQSSHSISFPHSISFLCTLHERMRAPAAVLNLRNDRVANTQTARGAMVAAWG